MALPTIKTSEDLKKEPRKLTYGRKEAEWFSPRQSMFGPLGQTAPSPKRMLVKPDLYNVSDIEGTTPNPLRSPTRYLHHTNPLNPSYNWNTSGPQNMYPSSGTHHPHDIYPLSPTPKKPNNPLELADIPGTSSRGYLRTRNDAYSAFDYSDVPRSTSTQCPQIRTHARDGREPLDNTRLGMWTAQGDTGRMLPSRREPTNPADPTYKLYGKALVNDDNVGRPRQLHPVNVNKSWNDSGEAGFMGRMDALRHKPGCSRAPPPPLYTEHIVSLS